MGHDLKTLLMSDYKDLKAKAELLDDMAEKANSYTKYKLRCDDLRSGFNWYDSEEETLFFALTDLITKANQLTQTNTKE